MGGGYAHGNFYERRKEKRHKTDITSARLRSFDANFYSTDGLVCVSYENVICACSVSNLYNEVSTQTCKAVTAMFG